jgi:hypothetical protein
MDDKTFKLFETYNFIFLISFSEYLSSFNYPSLMENKIYLKIKIGQKIYYGQFLLQNS